MLPTVPTQKLNGSTTSQFEKIIFTDFSGGLNTADPKASIRDNQFTSMVNYEINENKTLSTRKPYGPWLKETANTDVTNATIKESDGTTANTYIADSVVMDKFFKFEIHNDLGTLIDITFVTYTYDEGGDAGLYGVAWWDTSNLVWAEVTKWATVTSIEDVRLTKVSINNADDILIFPIGSTSASATLKRYSASAAAPAITVLGLSKPTVLPTTPGGVAYTGDQGIAETGALYYKVAYFYDDNNNSTKYGESPSSAIITTAVTGTPAAKNKVVFTIAALPAGVSKIIFYRSPLDNIDGPYRNVGEVDDLTTTFTDTRPIDFEGVEDTIDGSDIGAEGFKVMAPTVINGIVMGFEQGQPNKFIYSLQGNPDVWIPLNFSYLEDDGMGMQMFGANLYIFDRSNIYQVKDGDVFNNDPLRISRGTCMSGDTIQDIGTGLMWLGFDDVYWANFNTFNNEGDYPIRFGKAIRNMPPTVSNSQGHKSVATYHDDKYYLSMPLSQGSKNNITLTYDRFNGGWAQLSFQCSCVKSYKEKLFTESPDGYTIREHSIVGDTDYENYTEWTGTGSPVVTELKSKLMNFGHEFRNVLLSSLGIMTESTGTDIQATIFANNEEYNSVLNFSFGGSGDVNEQPEDALVWGEGLWGTGKWTGDEKKYYSLHKKAKRGMKGINFNITISSLDARDTDILGATVYYRRLEPPA